MLGYTESTELHWTERKRGLPGLSCPRSSVTRTRMISQRLRPARYAVRADGIPRSHGENSDNPETGNKCHLCRPLLDFSFFLHGVFCFFAPNASICARNFAAVKRHETVIPEQNREKSRCCCAAATSDWVFHRGFLVFSRPPRLQHHCQRLRIRVGAHPPALRTCLSVDRHIPESARGSRAHGCRFLPRICASRPITWPPYPTISGSGSCTRRVSLPG